MKACQSSSHLEESIGNKTTLDGVQGVRIAKDNPVSPMGAMVAKKQNFVNSSGQKQRPTNRQTSSDQRTSKYAGFKNKGGSNS